MSNEPLQVGIIGADTRASWSQVSHVPAVRALDGFALAAVATRREESAREAAAAFGARTWYADPAALIRDDSIDIVTIAVRVPAHHDLVLAALEAGKTVYCEAPLGVSPEQTRALAAAAGPGRHLIGLQGRLNPAVRRAAQVIADGGIGRPLHARIVSTSSGFGPVTASAYDYFERADAGANLVTITAGHTLDIAEAVLGDLAEVDARAATMWPRPVLADTGGTAVREVPDHLDVLGTTADGTVLAASVLGGVAPEEATFRFELRGTEGWLSLTGGSLYGVQAGDLTLTSSAAFEAPDAPAAKGMAAGPALNVAEAYATLLRPGLAGPDFALAVHNSELTAAVARAAATGERVTRIHG
ncbi:Gfo/Idh/MocA family protein [Actinoplanes sp. RD1]|uniref:Gfo/Idh/MocA family protein n=1 Tax=Actinoplanes sp. RD1 TaxID=3064538 RepID=UPI002740574B|nr:Gfo/Idh/MocA family oxidoreductase [Actinoplanes sp. RD1]